VFDLDAMWHAVVKAAEADSDADTDYIIDSRHQTGASDLR